jgi:hypothetical protein
VASVNQMQGHASDEEVEQKSFDGVGDTIEHV